MHNRLLAIVRIGFGLVVIVALAFQISVLVDQGVFKPTRFFAFFTVLSNLFAAAVLLEGGRRQLIGASPLPDMVRGAAVVYMTVTYLVFAVLLSDLQEQLQTNVVWVDTVLHRLMPVVVLVDWLVDPPRRQIAFRPALIWLTYPVVWTAFTLVRGALDGWYPYPFLDPANGGYGVVALYAFAILVGFIAVTWTVAAVGSSLGARRHEQP